MISYNINVSKYLAKTGYYNDCLGSHFFIKLKF